MLKTSGQPIFGLKAITVVFGERSHAEIHQEGNRHEQMHTLTESGEKEWCEEAWEVNELPLQGQYTNPRLAIVERCQ